MNANARKWTETLRVGLLPRRLDLRAGAAQAVMGQSVLSMRRARAAALLPAPDYRKLLVIVGDCLP